MAELPSVVPFVGPETAERASGRKFIARLGANENVFGPAPSAIVAMEKAASEVWKYPDPECHDLRHALAAHHNIPAENIVVGEGIDTMLGYLVRMFTEPGVKVVTSAGAYPTFNYHVNGFGGEIAAVPYLDDKEDGIAILEKSKEVDAPLCYLANPDNPMGSWHSAAYIQNMIDAVPSGTVLCLDEAYCEFAPEGCIPALDISVKNVVRMRTFSKAYGMAGARVGYAIGHRDLISAFDKVRNHFGMCRISQVGALAALRDQDWLKHVIDEVNVSKVRILDIAREVGLVPLPSATNFVTIECGQEGDYARKILAGLIELGIFVRMPFVAPEDRCIRISAGKSDDIDKFERALHQVLASLR